MTVQKVKDKFTLPGFILIFLILAAGLISAGYIYYQNYEQRYRAEVERRLSAVAGLKIGELVQWRKERLGYGAIFHRNGNFSGLVRRYLE
jgi:hypothetical protein